MAAKKRRRPPRRRRQTISTTQILIVAGAAVLAVGLLVTLNSRRLRSGVVGALAYETGITPEGEPYKGSPDAPLRLIEYSDFLCGHCGNFADSLDALSPDYIETGKVQVIFRNYAFLTQESVQAAQASECALDQGADAYWLYHDTLYANRGTGRTAYSKPRLKSYAQELGLDTASFNKCLDSGAKAEAVQTDLDEGRSQGVQATPTWFLNGQMVPGALPETELRQLFDSRLSEGS
jgi:protein-disulfide isomerase